MMKLQPVLHWPVSCYTFIEWVLDLCSVCVCVCVCVVCFCVCVFVFVCVCVCVCYTTLHQHLGLPRDGFATNIFFYFPSLCSMLPALTISSSLIWTNYKGLYYKIFSIFLLLCAFRIHISLSAHFPKPSNSPRLRHWILYPCKTEVNLQCCSWCFRLYVLRQTSGTERSSHKW